MGFEPTAFFEGFSRYMQEDRAGAVRFLAETASFEHWAQFECGAWLNEHRHCLGLNVDDWKIALEWSKGDTWLVDRRTSRSIGIEFKCIHNNKNCRTKIWELRRDLSDEKVLPKGLSSENTIRFGFAILVFLRYERGCEGGYQTLGGVVRDPWTPERFLEYFQTECGSADAWYGTLPKVRMCTDLVKVGSVERGCGIASTHLGSAIWLGMVTARNPQDRDDGADVDPHLTQFRNG
jgi:hypothetical protein